ncbi:hypothetical protein BHYA_0174g00260 [Botrytis hyacinthi]|uniref:Uncharacterized protein n=1 Tax=Botrytis hyacinthi TaxID=278943 RepID=A0A4Z1GHY3_9HELO|nr:hypothetical protein BHYA_0174g00260 [Botrytis hyacinthi]
MVDNTLIEHITQRQRVTSPSPTNNSEHPSNPFNTASASNLSQNEYLFAKSKILTTMNICKVKNDQTSVGARAEAPDAASDFPDPNTLVLYSTLDFSWRFCHRSSQEEIDEWRRNILWHARTIKGAILKSPSSRDSNEFLNFKILERFRKYFLPQHEQFMRNLDLGRQVKRRLILDVNPYCLEYLPEFIIEVGFERWKLDDGGQPVWKLCRDAFFIQDPVTSPPSQFTVISSECTLAEQIMQRLYCNGSEDFFPAINGQYIMQSRERTIIAIPTSESPTSELFNQRLSGQEFDPDYRDLCWARVWKLKRGPPDRSSDKREEDAWRLAPIMEARRGLSVPFATNNWTTDRERSAPVKLPTSTPKLSARELGVWKDYFQDPSAPRLCSPQTSIRQKNKRPSELLENFKNYYVNNQVEITDHDTILHITRTYSGMSIRSECHIVEYLRLSDAISSGIPEAIIALYYIRNPENGKSYLNRALFIKGPLKADSRNSSPGGRQLGARFLSIAEDLEEEISHRFYVPGGQNSGPLYGQYVQDDALGSVNIEKLDQGRGSGKGPAELM